MSQKKPRNTRKKLHRLRLAQEKEKAAELKAQGRLEKQLARPWRDASALEGCDVE